MTVENTMIKLYGVPTAVRFRRGIGPAVVCIHGNSLSREIFDPLFDRESLRGRFIVSYDLPGHGESGRPEDPGKNYRMEGYVRHLAELVERLEIDRCVFLGFSLGGHIAMQTAASGILRGLAGLVTIGSPPLESTADFPGAFLSLADGVSLFKGNIDRREAEIIASFITENPALVSGMAESILAADPAARTLLFETLAVDPFHDECAFVSAAALPLLVCFGEKEKIVNLDYVREKGLKARLGDSLRIIPDAVHLPDLRSPDGFVPLLLTFLESIDA